MSLSVCHVVQHQLPFHRLDHNVWAPWTPWQAFIWLHWTIKYIHSANDHKPPLRSNDNSDYRGFVLHITAYISIWLTCTSEKHLSTKTWNTMTAEPTLPRLHLILFWIVWRETLMYWAAASGPFVGISRRIICSSYLIWTASSLWWNLHDGKCAGAWNQQR